MVTLGALQKEDAELLKAVVLMTQPSVVVEFGYLHGDSAREILSVLPETSHLYSFDITLVNPIQDKRFTFINKPQQECDIGDTIDVVFFDASHDYNINVETMKKIKDKLSKTAIIAVHDTGTWKDLHLDTGGYWINDEYLHRPDERRFVNYLINNGYSAIHFHTTKTPRHGMTLLQKTYKLVL